MPKFNPTETVYSTEAETFGTVIGYRLPPCLPYYMYTICDDNGGLHDAREDQLRKVRRVHIGNPVGAETHEGASICQ